ncbi:MAG: hypothetical protein DDG58_13395 [Ardenticatenia bacterium]|nr:MAG: hypothetical protein DDG58_13395 [Ardenticatenia bacterium]
MIETIWTKATLRASTELWKHLHQAEPHMAERAYWEGYAMYSVRAREQWVHPYHKSGSIRATVRTWCTARPVVR